MSIRTIRAELGSAVKFGRVAEGEVDIYPRLGPTSEWDVAAGCAVAAFGTFFSMPWRLLPFPISVGMLAHAARWALISLVGARIR